MITMCSNTESLFDIVAIPTDLLLALLHILGFD